MKIYKLLLIALVTGLAVLAGNQQKAHAAYVSSNLIHDSIYLNAQAMNQSQIQSFLDGKGGYIARYSPYSDRDGAAVSAAQIIYEAAQDYGINPQVILATLQKEQSLVTAPNPTSGQLNFAMGYGCPDSSGCGTSYKGFYSQVDNATWQLRFNAERVLGNNSWWNPSLSYPCNGPTRYYNAALRTGNYVTFLDEAGTGYQAFTIANAATSSMYCYTPHAYPGSAAYYYSGSYNFVTAFEQWFGSTQPAVVISSPLRITGTGQGLFTGNKVTVSFDVTNNTGTAVNIGGMAVSVRDSQGNNFDYGLQYFTVPAGSTITYTSSQVFTREDNYTMTLTNYSGGFWRSDYPVSAYDTNARNKTVYIQSAPQVTQSWQMSPGSPHVGQNAAMTFAIKNTSSQQLNLGGLAVAVRGPSGQNFDYPLQSFVLAPGASQTYSATQTFPVTGTYNLTLVNYANGRWIADLSGVGFANNTSSFTVLPNPTISTGLQLSPAQPRAGQNATVTFTVTNYGSSDVNLGGLAVAVRGPSGQNFDYPLQSFTVAAGATKVYTSTQAFPAAGAYSMQIANYLNGVWSVNNPVPDSASVAKTSNFTVLPSPVITSGLSFDVGTVHAGQPAIASFTVQNYGDSDVNLGGLAVAVRGPSDENLDYPLVSAVVQAHGTYTYTPPAQSFAQPGRYRLSIVNYTGGRWLANSPQSDSGAIVRDTYVTVLPAATLTSGVTMSPTGPTTTAPAAVSFTVRNFSGQTVDLGGLAVAVRGPSGQNFDYPLQSFVLAPGASQTYSATQTFPVTGTYNLTLVNYANGRWIASTPAAETDSVLRTINITVH